MPDAILTRDGPVSVPLDYTVPNGGELLPLTVRATIDGTGAASPFYAAVQVLAPNGRVMGTYITKSIAAGASADVTWFPGVSDIESVLPLPGQILGAYAGLSPASDFTTNSTSYVQSNFPTNTSFTKVSSTSVLGIYGQFDLTPGGTQPDVLFVSVFIDGANAEATGCQTALANSFVTAVMSTVKGFAGTTFPPLAAGSHTVDVRVACDAGANFTLRTHSACDLAILEFEP